MSPLTSEPLLVLAGGFLLAVGVHVARDGSHPRRVGSAMFWTLLGVLVAGGKVLPPSLVGYALLVLVALVALGRVEAPSFREERAAERTASATRLGGRLLVPLLVVPVVTVLGGFGLDALSRAGVTLAAPAHTSQVALGLGCLIACIVALGFTRQHPAHAVVEGGRLVQLVGWTLLLPPLLAVLGGLFARAEVGALLARLVATALPVEHPQVAVFVYAAGMALFTVLLGNAFAAFPLLTLGVGLPFIVQQHHGDAAVMGALGMLSGYAGTLVTPMAANFNLVPAHLLELRDERAVIRAQLPFAFAIWLFNALCMAAFVYRTP